MFRRQNKLSAPGNGSVQKSKSMDILSGEGEGGGGGGGGGGGKLRSTTSVDTVLSEWQQLSLLKIAGPCVTCLLPHISEDFVCSALLAIGATPLMTEDPGDIDTNIENSKAIVVDVSAPTTLVEAFIASYSGQAGSLPLVLVASQAGTSDRKRDQAVRVIQQCAPTVVLGRRGDVYALSQAILEKTATDDKEAGAPVPVAAKALDLTASLPLPRSTEPLMLSPVRYRKKISTGTPPTSGSSSGGSTPVAITKKIQEQQGRGFKRLPSVNPLIRMKGQFRESYMCDVCPKASLRFAQLLAAHMGSFVHLYEVNTITNGELVAEVGAQAAGMENLHSMVPCCGAILAAALSCSTGPAITIKNCACGLALHYVACQEATASFKSKDPPPPGSLRPALLDKLYKMDELLLQSKAKIKTYSVGVSPS